MNTSQANLVSALNEQLERTLRKEREELDGKNPEWFKQWSDSVCINNGLPFIYSGKGYFVEVERIFEKVCISVVHDRSK